MPLCSFVTKRTVAILTNCVWKCLRSFYKWFPKRFPRRLNIIKISLRKLNRRCLNLTKRFRRFIQRKHFIRRNFQYFHRLFRGYLWNLFLRFTGYLQWNRRLFHRHCQLYIFCFIFLFFLFFRAEKTKTTWPCFWLDVCFFF